MMNGEKIKNIVWKTLNPSGFILAICVLTAIPFVVYSLLYLDAENPLANLSYILSAYTLVIVCLRIPPAIKKWRTSFLFLTYQSFMNSNQYTKKYYNDLDFRAKFSLYLSLAINFLFAIFKCESGYLFYSVWLWAVGFYYLSLGIIRFLLLKNVKISEKEKETDNKTKHGWKTYCLCGALLFLLAAVMSLMAIQMVFQNKTNEYGGWVIYLTAMYTFYYFITAVINVVRYARRGNPILSAAKNISLAGAAMSILVLQTSMIHTFNDREMNPVIFNAITGGIVCGFCIGMAVFMVVWANQKLKAGEGEK